MKPSQFTKQPMGSVLQKSEAETIARNIMVILKRTGDIFRELTWYEYVEERKKDNATDSDSFSSGEKPFFEQVSYLATGEGVIEFSPVWKEAFEKSLTQLEK